MLARRDCRSNISQGIGEQYLSLIHHREKVKRAVIALLLSTTEPTKQNLENLINALQTNIRFRQCFDKELNIDVWSLSVK